MAAAAPITSRAMYALMVQQLLDDGYHTAAAAVAAATLTPLPWRPEVGWLSCNLVHEDTELAHGPRNVLRSVQAKLAEHGVTLKKGVECEFFLLDGSAPAARPALSDTLDVQAKPCYDAHALMRRYELISTLVRHMEQLGWGPYQADHEE